jgi:fluoride exporter
MNYLLIAAGSALGGVARFALSTTLSSTLRVPFPWQTFVVNLLGGLLIGYLANRLDSSQRLLWITGFCGGFTTFSSFSIETVTLLEQQRPLSAAAYVVASSTLCIAAAALTYHTTK